MRDEAAIKRRLDVAFGLTNESNAARIYEALVAAEDAALERAAEECDALASIEGIAQGCAARIRALRSAPQQEKQLTGKEGK